MNSIKIFFILLFTLGLSHVHAAKLETDKQKLSYSMGIFFSQTIKRQDLKVDKAAFLQAIEDILDGTEPRLSTTEMQNILTEFQQQEQAQRIATAEQNKRDGIKYLEENKKKEGVTTLDSGLQYKVLKQGEGEKPSADSAVVVHYRGTLIDGTEFDSSYTRGEPTTLDVNRVIKGWQEALQLMPVGSKWQIVVPAELAYAERGAGGAIAPHATLLFDIELLEIK